MSRSFSLSLAAVDVLSQTLAISCRLFPFEIPSVGDFEEDRVRIARAVFTDLGRRGLLPGGEVAEDLEAALRVLADPDVGVAVMGTVENTRTIYARGSRTGETAVLAVQEGQTLRLEAVSPAGLARALVGLLPPAPPGPGQSVLVSQAPPEKRPQAEQGYVEQLRPARTTNESQLRIARAMMERPRTGAGFFTVSGKGRRGREVDAGVVGWIDTDAGRYLSLTTPPREEGEVTVTFSPADAPRLTHHLGELVDTFAPRR